MRSTPAERVPELAWRLVAALALSGSLVAFVALELSLRSLGFGPSVPDTTGLFARQLEIARGPGAIALVGSSAFQVGLDPAQIEEAFPGRTVANLALIGQSPIPVLELLADDEDFSGVAIFEFLPIRMYTPDDEDVVEAREYVRRVQSAAAYSGLETQLRLALQTRLAVLNPEVRLDGVLGGFVTRELPKPYQVFHANRFAPRDYTGRDIGRAEEMRDRIWRERAAREGLHGAKFDERHALLRRAADKIRARGGEVVFYRIHSSGQARNLEEDLFPRARYWDRFAAECPGICLHFEDIAGAEQVELAEGSHADRRDTAKVTASLIEGLRQTHVFSGGAP